MKKKRLPKIKTLRAKLWEITKRIIRERYTIMGTSWVCYTCDKIITEPKKCHTGHLVPRVTGGLLLYYNLDALRPQCDTCNRHRGGEGAIFYHRLQKELGPKRMVTLLGLIDSDQKPTRAFFEKELADKIAITKKIGI